MSRQINRRKTRQTVINGPVKPGSVLYRIMELVATKVAESLASEAPTTKRTMRDHETPCAGDPQQELNEFERR